MASIDDIPKLCSDIAANLCNQPKKAYTSGDYFCINSEQCRALRLNGLDEAIFLNINQNAKDILNDKSWNIRCCHDGIGLYDSENMCPIDELSEAYTKIITELKTGWMFKSLDQLSQSSRPNKISIDPNEYTVFAKKTIHDFRDNNKSSEPFKKFIMNELILNLSQKFGLKDKIICTYFPQAQYEDNFSYIMLTCVCVKKEFLNQFLSIFKFEIN